MRLINLQLAALKAKYITSGVAGFILGPVPVLNLAGAELIRIANQALCEYEVLCIKEILQMQENDARDLLDISLSDWTHPKDPKIYLALAIAASTNESEWFANMDKVNTACYEGAGFVKLDGVERHMNEDIAFVENLDAQIVVSTQNRKNAPR